MVNWLGATWLLQQQPLNLSLGGRLRLYYAELIGPVFHLKRWQIKRWGAWRVVFACLAFKHPKGLSFYHCLFKCIVTQRGHVFFSHYSLWRSLPSREIPLRFDPIAIIWKYIHMVTRWRLNSCRFGLFLLELNKQKVNVVENYSSKTFRWLLLWTAPI